MFGVGVASTATLPLPAKRREKASTAAPQGPVSSCVLCVLVFGSGGRCRWHSGRFWVKVSPTGATHRCASDEPGAVSTGWTTSPQPAANAACRRCSAVPAGVRRLFHGVPALIWPNLSHVHTLRCTLLSIPPKNWGFVASQRRCSRCCFVFCLRLVYGSGPISSHCVPVHSLLSPVSSVSSLQTKGTTSFGPRYDSPLLLCLFFCVSTAYFLLSVCLSPLLWVLFVCTVRHNKSHTICRRCGKSSFHIQVRTAVFTFCLLCLSRSFSLSVLSSWLSSGVQKHVCGSCSYPSSSMRRYNHMAKAKRRRCVFLYPSLPRAVFRPPPSLCFLSVDGCSTEGTGRMRYMKNMSRKFKNGFREGTQAKKVVAA